MKRNISTLKTKQYDILIVGGGIYGASAAREAAMRGLSTAIIDSRDFCGATSANSLKIIHGGLRYLQKMDIIRTCESAREQKNMMRIASNLIHPLPCVMPTRPSLMKSKLAMFAGMLLYNILNCTGRKLDDPEKSTPTGYVVSKSACQKAAPHIESTNITGGAIWYDALAHNSERLVLNTIRSAVLAGADAANYLKMTGFLESNGNVEGIQTTDVLTGNEIEIKAKLVINNTGPWTNETLALLKIPVTLPIAGLAMGMNFVLNKNIFSEYAVGLSAPGEPGTSDRLLFFVPWQNQTMVGTYYRSHEGSPDTLQVTDSDIELFLADVNKAHHNAKLTKDNITMIHAGLLPTTIATQGIRDPKLSGHYTIIDHAKHDKINGLLSVLGVKYTTARDVAERTINIAEKKLGISPHTSTSSARPLPGGDIKDFNGLLAHADLNSIKQRLIFNYGSEYKDIVELANDNEDTLKGEIMFAVRNEMAQTLADLVLRRTDLAIHGIPSDEILQTCAQLMAEELGWNTERITAEIEKVKSVRFPGSEYN